jgi:tetratricopeptide (TPR) repeat protein
MDSMGKPAEALVAAEKAIRLDPLHVAYRYLLGDAYTQLGRYEEAIPVLKRDLAFSELLWDHVDLVRDYTELGQEDAVRAEVVEVQRRSALDPNSPLVTCSWRVQWILWESRHKRWSEYRRPCPSIRSTATII